MGRGRAKAKQTKVARELKYSSPDWDPRRLEGELRGGGSATAPDNEDDDYVDPYEHDPYADGDDTPQRRR